MLSRMRKRSNRFVRTSLLALIAVLMLQGSAIAQELTPGAGRPHSPFVHGVAIGFDVVILRPLATVTLVVGAALLAPAAAMALVGGKGAKERVSEATELFVTEPFDEAFRRPLGDF
jgi:hypothetical protein